MYGINSKLGQFFETIRHNTHGQLMASWSLPTLPTLLAKKIIDVSLLSFRYC